MPVFVQRLRHWLIRRLVGRLMVICNATIEGRVIVKPGQTALMKDVSIVALDATPSDHDVYDWFRPLAPPRCLLRSDQSEPVP